MNTNIQAILLPLLSISLLGFYGCSTTTIVTDYDRDAPFETYRTYAVQGPSPEEIENININFPDRLNHITRAIESEMEKRGYKPATEKPDLVAAWFVKIDDKTRAYTTGSSVNMGYGGYYGWYGGMGYNTGYMTTEYEDYTVGTLIIDMVEGESGKLVWHATAQGEMGKNSTNTVAIENTIRDMFFRYKFKAGEKK